MYMYILYDDYMYIYILYATPCWACWAVQDFVENRLRTWSYVCFKNKPYIHGLITIFHSKIAICVFSPFQKLSSAVWAPGLLSCNRQAATRNHQGGNLTVPVFWGTQKIHGMFWGTPKNPMEITSGHPMDPQGIGRGQDVQEGVHPHVWKDCAGNLVIVGRHTTWVIADYYDPK